jgi:hypothetical protein
MLIVIILIVMVVVVGGITAVFVLGGGSEDEPVIVTSTGKTTQVGDGTTIVDIDKKYGDASINEISDVSTLDRNRPYLLHQTGMDPCVYNDSYGIENGKLYASKGCRGVFYMNDKVGFCGANDTHSKTLCEVDKIVANGDELSGLADRNVQLMHDMSRNKCIPGSYGTDKVGYVYADGGCQGYFRMGSLQGYCYSNGQKVQCPLGKTLELEGTDFPMLGLRSDYLDYRDENANCKLYTTDKQLLDPNLRTYGFKDENTIFVKDGCSGEFKWGKLEGTCDAPVIGEKLCKIGSDSNSDIKF